MKLVSTLRLLDVAKKSRAHPMVRAMLDGRVREDAAEAAMRLAPLVEADGKIDVPVSVGERLRRNGKWEEGE